MWIIQIRWLRLLGVSLICAALAVISFAYLVQASTTDLLMPPLWLLPMKILLSILGTLGFGYLCAGAFLNGTGALLASFRAKYQWRSPWLVPLTATMLAAVTLSACTNRPELPHATGPWVHLNGDKYPLDQNDISHAPPESGRLIGAQR